MSKHLERDLDRLRKAVLTMASAVEEAVHMATESLKARDPDLARRCVEADTLIDRLENEVQEECLKVLALHQPVAGDLRHVSAILLITTDLERMGDLAVGIARRSVKLARTPGVTIPERLFDMARRATVMVRKSLDAFVRSDPHLARQVIALDEEVDDDNDALIGEAIALMQSSPEAVPSGVSLFSAIRHYERIADHATNVSEDVIYLVEGEQVRHAKNLLT